MTDAQQNPGKSRYRALSLIAAISVYVLCLGWQWWVDRPEKVARHFMVLLSKGQIPEASAMLVDPSSMAKDNDNLVLKADDGTSITLTSDDLPLVGYDRANWSYRNGLEDRLSSRFRFLLVTFSPAVQNRQKRGIEVHCTAEGTRITIKAIK